MPANMPTDLSELIEMLVEMSREIELLIDLIKSPT